MHATPAAAETQRQAPRARSARIRATGEPVFDYATRVVNKRQIAGPHVRAACARHLRDLQDGHLRGLRYNAEKAAYTISFFENFLRLNGGKFEGLPFLLAPWQKFIIGSIYGWEHAATGFRRFETGYVEIGKGNGKSPLAAGMGLAALIIDGEDRAEVYAAATKKDQAMILFRDAVAMVDQNPELAACIVKSGRGSMVWNLAYPARGSFFRPISSDDGQSGPRPHFALVDEVHEHKSGDVLDMLRRGFKGRTQPFILEITNSGSSRTSICYQHHEASIRALSARPNEAGFDDSWFAYICGLDAGDDWMKNPACWEKANPNIDISMPRSTLEKAVREARNIPSKRNLVARLHFCEWTDAEEAWIGAEAWMKAELMPEEGQTHVDREHLKGRRAYLGGDLSKRQDLTALAVFVPDDDDNGGDAFVEFWSPNETMIERGDRDRVDYLGWRESGYLQGVAGRSLDYGPVCRDIGNLVEDLQLEVVEAAFDRWRMDEFKKEMAAVNVELPIVEFGQGFQSMAPAVDRLENMILNGRLRIHYNPILRWNAASAVTEEDPAGNRKFSKRKTTGRIDGLVALVMAVGCAAKPLDPNAGPSVYETRGILSMDLTEI